MLKITVLGLRSKHVYLFNLLIKPKVGKIQMIADTGYTLIISLYPC